MSWSACKESVWRAQWHRTANLLEKVSFLIIFASIDSFAGALNIEASAEAKLTLQQQEKQQQEKAAAGIAAAQPVEKQIRSWNLCCWIRLLPVEMQNIMLLIQHIIIVKLEDSAREWPCNLGLRPLSILGTLFWAQDKPSPSFLFPFSPHKNNNFYTVLKYQS